MKEIKNSIEEDEIKSALADATKRLINKIEYLRYLKSLTYIETENKDYKDVLKDDCPIKGLKKD